MSVYALNNYSEYLPSHAGYKLKVISGNNYLENLSGHSGFKLKVISGSNPINCLSIVRESVKAYGDTKFPEEKIAADSDIQFPELSGSNLSAGSSAQLSALSDSALVASLEKLRGRERKLQLKLLLYLIET